MSVSDLSFVGSGSYLVHSSFPSSLSESNRLFDLSNGSCLIHMQLDY